MKKIFLLLAVIIALVLLVMPFVTGKVAELATQDMAAQLSGDSSAYGELDLLDYKRGYRSTSAKLEWRAPTQYESLFSEPVVYLCNGHHGVLSFAYQCRAQNIPGYTAFVAEELGGLDPLTVGGEVSVLGETTHKLDLQPFSMTNDNGETINVNASAFDLMTDNSFNVFDLNGEFGGMSVIGGDGILTIEPILVDAATSINQHKLAIGDVELSATGAQLLSKDGGQVDVGEITMSVKTTERDQFMAINSQFRVDEFSRSMGVQIEGEKDVNAVEDLDLEFGISNIDMAKLAAFVQHVQKLSPLDGKQALSTPQESTRNAQTLAILPAFEDLLIKGLVMHLGLRAEHEGSLITADLDWQLLQDLSLGDFVLLSVQPQAFFNKLDLKFSNQIPAKLIELSEAGKVSLAASQLYRKVDQHYLTKVRVSDKGIKLNGESVTAEEFLTKWMPSGRQ